MAGYAEAAPQGVTGSKSRYKAKDSDYRLTHIDIEMADNGYLVTCRHEPIRMKGGPDIPYKEPTKLVFEDHESLMKAFPTLLSKKS